MKSILQSIKPQYCELIASGKKTIEIRKTRPKIQTPFKVYIYETKTGYVSRSKENDILVPIKYRGKCIGEYVCDEIQELRFDALEQCYLMRKARGTNLDEEFMSGTCLSYKEAYEYCKNLKCNSEHTDMFYSWHISDPKIYDKPKVLSEFIVKGECSGINICSTCDYFHKATNYNSDNDCKLAYMHKGYKPLTRPPQSWCYVEEV